MTSSEALWALFAIFCVQAVAGAAVLLLGRRGTLLATALPYLISAAAGVLLATACLDLLPEAMQASAGSLVPWETLLLSLLCLFCLEAATKPSPVASSSSEFGVAPFEAHPQTHEESHAFVHRHSHESPRGESGALSLVLGSALHSLVDGIAIGAAFSAGHRPGWSAAIAVGLHELPHRLGDFSLLLHKGISRRLAAQLALGAGATAFMGGLGVIALGQRAHASHVLLPVSAATFLYIALADLVPELHGHHKGRQMWAEIACLCGGAALIAVVIHLPGE